MGDKKHRVRFIVLLKRGGNSYRFIELIHAANRTSCLSIIVVDLCVGDCRCLIFLKIRMHVIKKIKKPAPARDIKMDKLIAFCPPEAVVSGIQFFPDNPPISLSENPPITLSSWYRLNIFTDCMTNDSLGNSSICKEADLHLNIKFTLHQYLAIICSCFIKVCCLF